MATRKNLEHGRIEAYGVGGSSEDFVKTIIDLTKSGHELIEGSIVMFGLTKQAWFTHKTITADPTPTLEELRAEDLKDKPTPAKIGLENPIEPTLQEQFDAINNDDELDGNSKRKSLDVWGNKNGIDIKGNMSLKNIQKALKAGLGLN